MSRAALACLALAAALGGHPTDARADSKAEQLKAQGFAAASKKDWAKARDYFQESYALDPRPLTLFNLAGAQDHTEQLIAARNSYRTFLEQTKRAREHEAFRRSATEAIAKLDREIPTITVRVAGTGGDGVTVQLDGRTLSPAELAAPIAVDPGTHTAVAVRDGEAIARNHTSVRRGERGEVVLPIERLRRPDLTLRGDGAGGRSEPGPAPPAKRGRSILRSPWFWGVAVGVIAAAAGAGYYYGIYEPAPHAPTPSTLGDGALEVP